MNKFLIESSKQNPVSNPEKSTSLINSTLLKEGSIIHSVINISQNQENRVKG